jgi:hypothetical protein
MKSKITLFATLLLISFQTYSSAPTWAFAKDATTGWSQTNSVTIDALGNVYVCGAFYDSLIVFGNDTLRNVNSLNYPGDVLLVKYDANGNFLWARAAGGNAVDVGNAVTTDAFGNVYITGNFSSDTIHFGSAILTNPDSLNLIFLAKYDANGAFIWAKSAGGKLGQTPNAIASDAVGNVYIAGQFLSDTLTFGTTSLINVDTSTDPYLQNSDLFLTKYDTSGNVIWAKRTGGFKNDAAISLLADAAGHIYMDGIFQSDSITFGSTVLFNGDTTGSTTDMFLVKFDTSGIYLWAKKISSIGNEKAGTITIDAANNLYVTGTSDNGDSISFGNLLLSNYTGRFLAKYDSSGMAHWAVNAGGFPSSQTDGNFVTADAFGNVYLAGNFQSLHVTFGSITLNNTSNNATNDLYLVKYDSSGNAQWAKLVGGVYDEIATAMTNDAFGNVYLTGYGLSPTIVFAPTTLSNPGMFLAKIDNTTGINEITQNNNGVLIYPNPASTILNIHTQFSNSNSQLIISDITGREIHKETLTGIDNSISISNWSEGIYFYEIRGNGINNPVSQIFRGKFVKEN